jgi:guanylate kinase
MAGLLVILSSPSGGGKTTVIQELKKDKSLNFISSVSATTRRPRTSEISGKDYFFLTPEEFQVKINNDQFLEWEQVHQEYYGTLKEPIDSWLRENKIILFALDVNGALNVKNKRPEQTITIFLEPPSIEALITRLKNRKTETTEAINKRLARIPFEMQKKNQFDYVVINDKLQDTIEKIISIIKNIKQ